MTTFYDILINTILYPWQQDHMPFIAPFTHTVKGHNYSPSNKKTSKLGYTQCFVLVCAIYRQKIYN